MQPQLVRPAGHGGERENARDSVRFQNAVPAHGALSAWVDDAEQAPVSDFVDRKRNFARAFFRAAIDGGQICFVDLPVLHHLAELCVDMRVFGQQHHAERVPVEARDGMDAAGLVRLGVVAEQRVCERPVVFFGRRMDELPGGLIERDQALVLIENIDRKRLGEKSLGRFFDFYGDFLPRQHARVGVDRDAVEEKRILPFEPLDKAGREPQLAPQKRQKLSLALCSMRKHHRARLLSEILPYHTAKKPKLQANSHVPAFRRVRTRFAPPAFFP